MALDPQALDARLIAEHGGSNWPLLSRLHEEAAAIMDNRPEARFHLTHAWVYALVDGDGERVAKLEARLRAMGGL